MYTRCPSCRAQISFELPQSADSFPEGYKHKIKCPSCGVTIGVKIPRVEAAATVQPTYTPANPAASDYEPTYTAAAPVPADPKAEKKAANKAKNANKKSGVGRNIFIMLFSLLFVALFTVAYLWSEDKLSIPTKFQTTFEPILMHFNVGIYGWQILFKGEGGIKGTEIFKELLDFHTYGLSAIVYFAQMAFFALACVNFLVAFIGACGKKYARAWQAISAIIIFLCALFVFFFEFLIEPAFEAIATHGNVLQAVKDSSQEYFATVMQNKLYTVLVLPVLGLLQFIFAMCFTKSLKRKAK